MTGLNSTLANLMRHTAPPGTDSAARDIPDGADRLADLPRSGSNPGALRARTYIPDDLPAGSPLVVVLHGCTQTARGYDHGSGWSRLADELGLALLFPQQQRANNINLCFNWFTSNDSQRGSGEAQSIQQMITAMVVAHGIDPGRIFVTGLSAGGAMTSIMLATYPEIFAGGAIIAGLPYGSLAFRGDAFARMRGDGYPSNAQLGCNVEEATDYRGPWPTVSVWQGSADTVIDPSNAERIVGQWQSVHGLSAETPERETVDGIERLTWRDASGRPMIESWEIDGMGHGTPLDTRGVDGCGVTGPYMLEAGISSTRQIARSWGLTTGLHMNE